MRDELRVTGAEHSALISASYFFAPTFLLTQRTGENRVYAEKIVDEG